MASQTADRRSQVLVGDLPQDFLRLETTRQQQIDADMQAAQLLQAQQAGGFSFTPGNMKKLSITVVEAKLVKNYGITKMDPYCRVRVGHSVFETQTSHNGSKTPRWNKTFYCYVPAGVEAMYLELFDERAFTMDERIAWAHVVIPPKVTNGETVDEWYGLSGKQGEEKEGMINIVLSYTTAPIQPQGTYMQQPIMYSTAMPPVMVVPTAQPIYYPQQVGGVPVTTVHPQQQQLPPHMQPQMQPQPQPQQQQQQQQQQQPIYTAEDVQQLKDMFPNTDNEVIKSILEANRGNKDATINNLLGMES